jgi:hypothetical protein
MAGESAAFVASARGSSAILINLHPRVGWRRIDEGREGPGLEVPRPSYVNPIRLTLRASVEDERGSDRELAAQDRGGHGRDAPTSWITLARVNIYPDGRDLLGSGGSVTA